MAVCAAIALPIAALTLFGEAASVPTDATQITADDVDASPPVTDGAATATPTTAPNIAELDCCDEGRIGLYVVADREFDPWTREPSADDQAFMRDRFDSMMVFSPYFDPRLEWFPNATIYLDAAAIYATRANETRFDEHPDWVLRDEDGEPLYIDFACDIDGGCPQYIADVGNPEFRDDFAERVEALIELGYSSLLLDDVNLVWRISDRQGNERRPIDPRTGDEMTLAAWQEAFVGLVEHVRSTFPDLEIAHNSIWFTDSPTLDNELVDRQIQAADVVFLERGATDSGLVAGDSTFGFRTFLEFIDRVHALDRPVVLFDKTDGDLEDQIFNLATGLLINRGDDQVGTARDEFVAPPTYWEGFDVDLGHAVGDRYDWNGLIRRDFAEGIVLVAEPGSDPVSVNLGGDFVDLDGDPVEIIQIEGGRAAVLRSA